MLIVIIILIIIFILYLEYKEYNINKYKTILEDNEIKLLIKNCNPKIIQIYKTLNHYDKRLLQIYINDIIKTNYKKVNKISKNELYTKFKSTSYMLCSKYLLDIINNNSVINTPLASVFSYICQIYI